MTRAETAIRRDRLIAVLPGDYLWSKLPALVSLVLAEDFHILEFTLTSPSALQWIKRLQDSYGAALIVGAGSASTVEDCQLAVHAGAEFIVAPHLFPDLPGAEASECCLFIPGVFSPSEVHMARTAGWRLQKLFPGATGGAAHVKNLCGPYPDVSLIPTGGADKHNARAFLKAGAVAVGIGFALFKPGPLAADAERRLAELAASLRDEEAS